MINEELLKALSVITEEERKILGGSSHVDNSLYSSSDFEMINSEKLLIPGRNITIRPHTRFIDFPEHRHDYIEMIYMCEGNTLHTIGNDEVRLREGELLVLGRSATHKIRKAGKNDIAVNFIIRPDFLETTLPYLRDGNSLLKDFLIRCLCDAEGSSFLYYKVADCLPIQNLMEVLLWSFINNVPERGHIYEMTMGLLFVHLLSSTDKTVTDDSENDIVFIVLRDIEKDCVSCSLDDIAEREHYDKSWLSRIIKERTGKNFTELLQEKRMTKAAWQLKYSDDTVDNIAHNIGYENRTYFYKIFAERYGMTPGQYRNPEGKISQ